MNGAWNHLPRLLVIIRHQLNVLLCSVRRAGSSGSVNLLLRYDHATGFKIRKGVLKVSGARYHAAHRALVLRVTTFCKPLSVSFSMGKDLRFCIYYRQRKVLTVCIFVPGEGEWLVPLSLFSQFIFAEIRNVRLLKFCIRKLKGQNEKREGRGRHRTRRILISTKYVSFSH